MYGVGCCPAGIRDSGDGEIYYNGRSHDLVNVANILNDNKSNRSGNSNCVMLRKPNGIDQAPV